MDSGSDLQIDPEHGGTYAADPGALPHLWAFLQPSEIPYTGGSLLASSPSASWNVRQEPKMWVDSFNTISVILLLVLLFPLSYLLLLAIAAIRSGTPPDIGSRSPSTRFMIVIPAHDEAT